MPSKDDHLGQARHNSAFFDSFDRLRFSDWAATTLFYIGLHYIDAFLATKNIHPGKHDVRDKYVAQLHELRGIYNDYARLKSHSRTARYYPPANFSENDIRTLEQTHLGRIYTEIRRHLGLA
jgi:hypothetical protein